MAHQQVWLAEAAWQAPVLTRSAPARPCWCPQETIRQQDWKIDRLTKDNRALEAANVELRSKLEELKDENLQVGGAAAWAASAGWVLPVPCTRWLLGSLGVVCEMTASALQACTYPYWTLCAE